MKTDYSKAALKYSALAIRKRIPHCSCSLTKPLYTVKISWNVPSKGVRSFIFASNYTYNETELLSLELCRIFSTLPYYSGYFYSYDISVSLSDDRHYPNICTLAHSVIITLLDLRNSTIDIRRSTILDINDVI